VQGHCPGGFQRDWSTGVMDIAVLSNGIRVDIEYTNPNVCSDGSGHWINLQKGLGWVQIGWWKYAGSVVKGYCEIQHPTSTDRYKIDLFTISAASHAYKFSYDTIDGYWDCSHDTSTHYSYSGPYYGITSSSDEIEAGGETWAEHGQIGRMWGSSLLLSDMQYRKASDGQWPAVNLTLTTPNWPYGNSEPYFGQIRVWTYAH
jgi:hypothetical protein